MARTGDQKMKAQRVPGSPGRHSSAFNESYKVGIYRCTLEDAVVSMKMVEGNIENSLQVNELLRVNGFDRDNADATD